MDPIADMLIRIKNAAKARIETVVVPHSEIKFQVATILMKKGYLSAVEPKMRKSGKSLKKTLELSVAYVEGEPKLHDIERVSKVSRRVYTKKSELYPIKSGFGVSIVTTSKGVMADADARKAGVGGEVIARVW